MDRRKFVAKLSQFLTAAGLLSINSTKQAAATPDDKGNNGGTQSPPLSLESIQFHGSFGGGQAHSIRLNEKDDISDPQWRREENGQIISQPILYVRHDPVQERLFRATFKLTGQYIPTLQVRALSARAENVLSAVGERTVFFDGHGVAPLQFFSFDSAQINQGGVGVHNNSWRWQYLSPGTEWMDFAVSEHKVYTTLARPNLPWRYGNASNKHIPWADALDLACEWAKGATTLEQTAKLVTQALYNTGRVAHPTQPDEKFFRYDPINKYTDSDYYSTEDNTLHVNRFFLTAFLNRLRGEVGLGEWVNCMDCATAVVTFANLLGCELNRVTISNNQPSFETNWICAVGSDASHWQRRSAANDNEWPYHAVAWQGELNDNGLIYDSCLAVDGDGDCTTRPNNELIPAGLRFGGAEDEASYLFRLVDPAYRLNFRGTSTRPPLLVKPNLAPPNNFLLSGGRTVYRNNVTAAARRLRNLKTQFSFSSARRNSTQNPNLFVLNFRFAENDLPGWNLESVNYSEERGWATSVESFWRSTTAGERDGRLMITVFECSSSTAAREILLQMPPSIHAKLSKHPGVGDMSFKDERGTLVLFARGNLIVRIGSIGSQTTTVVNVALALDQTLMREPAPADNVSGNQIKSLSQDEATITLRNMDSSKTALDGSAKMSRFLSPSLEVTRRRGSLRLNSTSPNPDKERLSVFTIMHDQNSSRQDYQVTKRPRRGRRRRR